MRGRGWILAAIAGITGLLAFGLCMALVTITGGPGHSVSAVPIGGPFTLTDDTGATVTDKDLAGKPSVIYFGYTFCPEVCPTTLTDMSHWIAQLGPDADKLNYVFVTIDPQRDTVKLMHDYVSAFDKHIRGFTGTPEQIAKIAQEYRVYYKRIPTDDGNYLMDHSSLVYLMGPDGKFVSMIGYQENDVSALTKLRNLVALTPSS